MTDKITPANLDAKLVYDMLDKSEGEGKVGDKKLEAQTWNIFLEATGLKGKQVNYSIAEGNGKKSGAIWSLKSYLKRADATTKQNVANYLNDLGVEISSTGEVTASKRSAEPQTISQVQQPVQQNKTTETTPAQPVSGKGALAGYNANMSAEAKALKPSLMKSEGKKPGTYIAPEGQATVGYGHLLTNKPKFLSAIDGAVTGKKDKDGNPIAQSVAWKKEKLAQALKNPANRAALKKCLEAELAVAAKNTGISSVSLSVSDNLQLTEAQMELLLNSDIKKAERQMEKEVGKEVLKKRTTNQKTAALDMYYNLGSLKSKAPKFLKYFKEGDMINAAQELDINKANGKRAKGLIKRNYERAKLLFPDGKLPIDVQIAILNEYNLYLGENKKSALSSFNAVVKAMKA